MLVVVAVAATHLQPRIGRRDCQRMINTAMMTAMKILELASSRKLLTAGEPVTGLTSPAFQEIQGEAAGRFVLYNQIHMYS